MLQSRLKSNAAAWPACQKMKRKGTSFLGSHLCKSVMEQIMRRKDAGPFLVPVDFVAFNIPDYPTIITKPMDFGTVVNKLDNSEYTSFEEFKADVNQVFINCRTYNSPDHAIVKMANAVDIFWKGKLKTLTEQIEKLSRIWTLQERQAFLNVFFAFDITLGRWDLFHKKEKLGRSIQELKFFAVSFLKHCLNVSDDKTRRIFQGVLTYVCSETINHKDCTPDPSFADPSFAKLVQSQLLPWARKIRLLQRLTELLNPLPNLAALELPPVEGQLASWWGEKEDAHLLVGIYKHGLCASPDIWGDATLCFFDNPQIKDPPGSQGIPQVDGSADGDGSIDPHASHSEQTGALVQVPQPPPEEDDAEGKQEESSSSSSSSEEESEVEEKVPTAEQVGTDTWPTDASLEDRARKILDAIDRTKPIEEQERLRKVRRDARELLRQKVRDRDLETWTKSQRAAFILEVQRNGPGVWEIIKQRAVLDKAPEALAAFWNAVLAEAQTVAANFSPDGLPYDNRIDYSVHDFSVFKTAEHFYITGKESEFADELDRIKGTTSVVTINAWLLMLKERLLQHPSPPNGTNPFDPLGSTEDRPESATHGESETGATERGAAREDKMDVDSDISKPATFVELDPATPFILDLTVSPSAAHKLLKVSQLLDCLNNLVLPHASLRERIQSAQLLYMPQWWNSDLDLVLLETIGKYGLWCGDMSFLEDRDHPFYTGCEKEGRGANSVVARQRNMKEFLCHTPPLLHRLEYLCILVLDSADSPTRVLLETNYHKGFSKVWKGGVRSMTEWGDDPIYRAAPKPLEEYKINPTTKVKRDQDGRPIMPVHAKGGVVVDLGTIEYARPGFHNRNYIWPIGYKCLREMPSIRDSKRRVTYTSEIVDGGTHPLFRVTPEDHPPLVHAASSG